MKYDILTATTSRRLIDNVNDYMRDGWRPIGNVSMAANPRWDAENYVYYFAQAIVKDGADDT